jgi:hypothetical protein
MKKIAVLDKENTQFFWFNFILQRCLASYRAKMISVIGYIENDYPEKAT